MKLEKINSMFKKRGDLKLYNKIYFDNTGETKIAIQYLCDGSACYALENLPLFDEDTIHGLLGIDPEKDVNCFVGITPKWLLAALEDSDDSDIPVYPASEMFGYTVFRTYYNSEKHNFPEVCLFVLPELLSPLSDKKYEFYSRTVTVNNEDVRVIVAKAGLITKAVMLPHSFSDYECTRNLKIMKNAFEELQEQDQRNRAAGDDHPEIVL